MLNELVKVANDLDQRGLFKEADDLDRILFKYAQLTGNVLERVDQGAGKVQSVSENIAGKAKSLKDSLDAAQKTKAIVNKSFEFIGKLIGRTANLGTLMENTRIPGIAFVGQMLQLGVEVHSLVSKIKEIWDLMYRLLDRKIKTGTIGRVCLSSDDLGEYRDQIIFFLGLLSGPLGSYFKTALKIADGLEALGVGVNDLNLCVGREIQAEAVKVNGAMESQDYADQINEYIALNHSTVSSPAQEQSAFA